MMIVVDLVFFSFLFRSSLISKLKITRGSLCFKYIGESLGSYI